MKSVRSPRGCAHLCLLAIISICVLALSGCTGGAGTDDCLNTYGYDTDQYGDITLLAMYNGNYSHITFEDMNETYIEIEMCVIDNNTPGPFVAFQSHQHLGLGGGWGVYTLGGLLNINTDQIVTPRNCHSDRETLRHEYVHHVLYLNGQEWGHSNEAFVRCDALGPKVCNGVPCPK